MRKSILAAALAVLIVGGGSATAAKLISSKDIRNGTIRNADVHKSSISLNRLSPGVQRLLKQVSENSQVTADSQSSGAPGAKGDKGEKGDPGASGTNGSSGSSGANGLDSDQPRVVQAGALRGFTLAPKGDNGDTDENGSLAFTEPPSDPTLGKRSLRFGSATGKPVAVYLPLPSGYSPSGQKPLLGELTKASYGSLIETQPQNALDVSFQIEVVKSTATRWPSGYTTVVYEPYQNGSSEKLDEWHRHSVDTGLVWSTQALPSGDCTQAKPCPFRTFVEQNPNAEVLTVKLRIGQNSGEGWPGFVGYVDDISYGFGPVTRFDLGN